MWTVSKKQQAIKTYDNDRQDGLQAQGKIYHHVRLAEMITKRPTVAFKGVDGVKWHADQTKQEVCDGQIYKVHIIDIPQTLVSNECRNRHQVAKHGEENQTNDDDPARNGHGEGELFILLLDVISQGQVAHVGLKMECI